MTRVFCAVVVTAAIAVVGRCSSSRPNRRTGWPRRHATAYGDRPQATAQAKTRRRVVAYGRGPVPQAGRPDLTGVWFGGASGDLSRATVPGQELMLTPLGKQRWDTVDHAKDPNTACLPPGPARMIMMAHPAMIVQRPDVVVVLTESQRTYRIIYTDGRGHPSDIADYPEWMGSSIGKWEGDTLVVDTVGVNERSWLDTAGHEHSDKLHMTERFRLSDANTLEHVVTYDDPVFFVKPFTTRRLFKRQVGDRILDHSCLENEKDLNLLVPTLGDAGR